MLSKACRKRIGFWCHADDGASAVEFALFAPILFFSLLGTVDVGLALTERMTIDHVLRAGAESAMADQGEEEILGILKATASKNFTLSSSVDATGGTLSLSVARFCACHEAPEIALDCSQTCSASKPTIVSYRMSASKAYESMIIPGMSFNPSIQVQVR